MNTHYTSRFVPPPRYAPAPAAIAPAGQAEQTWAQTVLTPSNLIGGAVLFGLAGLGFWYMTGPLARYNEREARRWNTST